MAYIEEEAVENQSYFYYFSSPTQFSWTYSRGYLRFNVSDLPGVD